MDVELGEIKPDTVEEDPKGTAAADEDGLPPPVVVFGAKLDIGCNNGDLYDSDNIDNADDGQETEDIVVTTLVLPQAAENEEQFDEYDSERDQTSQKDAVTPPSIPRLLWYLSRYAARFRWMFIGLAVVKTIPAADVHKRDLYEEPKEEEADEGAEGKGRTRSLSPYEEVQNEDCCK